MHRARSLPPAVSHLVGMQRAAVKLILDDAFNDVREHRDVVAMARSGCARRELDRDRLDIAEIPGGEDLLQELSSRDWTRRRGLLRRRCIHRTPQDRRE